MKFSAGFFSTLLPFIFAAGLFAQPAPLVFKAADLQRVAFELTGTENGWPVVNRLAVYDPSANTFKLDANALALLRRYSEADRKREQTRKIYLEEVESGAKIFAFKELSRCDSLYDLFLRHTVEGEAQKAIEVVVVLQKEIEALSFQSKRNRIAKTEARLAEKQGRVDRQMSALGAWKEVQTGELFQEEDGIRTGKTSSAVMHFVNGARVKVQGSTTAIVRQNRIDQFSRDSETEVQLNVGSLSASAVSDSKRKNEFRIRAGGAVASVNSTDFWAETNGTDQVTMANYNGEVIVQLQNGSITLKANEGAVVRKGRETAQILKLLSAPVWAMSTSDTTVFTDSVTLRWTAVPGAEYYMVETAPTASFDHSARLLKTTTNGISADQLLLGMNYFRVRAHDSKGIRGNVSALLPVTRNPDLQPPPLVIDNDISGAVYVWGDSYFCSGTTEKGSRITVNGQIVPVDPDGRFGVQLQLDNRINKIEVLSLDPAGNKNGLSRLIVRMQEEQLYRIDWSVPSKEEGHIKRAELIGAFGVAYAPLKVVVKVGRQVYETTCKPNGSWELYFNVPVNARSVDIRFVVLASGKEIGRRTFLLY